MFTVSKAFVTSMRRFYPGDEITRNDCDTRAQFGSLQERGFITEVAEAVVNQPEALVPEHPSDEHDA
jgi:hypothetical protein